MDTEQYRAILQAELDRQLKPLREQMSEHHRTLYGNGDDGVRLEVDRLKRWRQSVSRFHWTVIGAAVTTVVTSIGTLLVVVLGGGSQ